MFLSLVGTECRRCCLLYRIGASDRLESGKNAVFASMHCKEDNKAVDSDQTLVDTLCRLLTSLGPTSSAADTADHRIDWASLRQAARTSALSYGESDCVKTLLSAVAPLLPVAQSSPSHASNVDRVANEAKVAPS